MTRPRLAGSLVGALLLASLLLNRIGELIF
jgi:hypothetical protein